MLDGEAVLLEGWCCKRSAHLHVFRHRWLVLTPTRLLPFRRKRGYQQSERPTEPFAVASLRLVRAIDEDGNSSALMLSVGSSAAAAQQRHVLLAFVGAPPPRAGGSGSFGALCDVPALLGAACCVDRLVAAHDMRFLRDSWATSPRRR